MSQKKLALSLRGGGARCCTYFGFLRLLEENNIKIDMIIGSSGGALIGSAYSRGKSIDEILSHQDKWSFRKYSGMDALRDRVLLSDDKMYKYISDILGSETDISETNIPFFVQVTNLNTNDGEILASGNLAKAVEASCAIPMLIPPIQIGENLYVDGDFASGFGVEYLKSKGAEVVVGLSCPSHHEITGNSVSIVERVIDPIRISSRKLLSLDLALNPVDLLLEFDSDSGLLDYRRNRELMDAGYEASLPLIAKLKELLA